MYTYHWLEGPKKKHTHIFTHVETYKHVGILTHYIHTNTHLKLKMILLNQIRTLLSISMKNREKKKFTYFFLYRNGNGKLWKINLMKFWFWWTLSTKMSVKRYIYKLMYVFLDVCTPELVRSSTGPRIFHSFHIKFISYVKILLSEWNFDKRFKILCRQSDDKPQIIHYTNAKQTNKSRKKCVAFKISMPCIIVRDTKKKPFNPDDELRERKS